MRLPWKKSRINPEKPIAPRAFGAIVYAFWAGHDRSLRRDGTEKHAVFRENRVLFKKALDKADVVCYNSY